MDAPFWVCFIVGVVGRMKVFLFLLFLSYPVSFTCVQGATFLEEYNGSYLGTSNTAAPSLSPLLPASPQYPMLPNGSVPLLSGKRSLFRCTTHSFYK